MATKPVLSISKHTAPPIESSERNDFDVETARQRQSDAELLELYVVGHRRDALGQLISRYAPLVANVCRSTIADTRSAEDAFQATFLVLCQSAKNIRNRHSLAAWLHGVAYRISCRQRKTKLRTFAPADCETMSPNLSYECDPLTELARTAEIEILNRELEALPDALREPLVEHYFLGHSAPAIAERMELSVAAIESRLRRGRKLLRRRMAERGIGLSVVVAASLWHQEKISAAEIGRWTAKCLDQCFQGQGSAGSSNEPSTVHNIDVSSLAQGELAMLKFGLMNTGLWKGAAAIGLAAALGVATYLAANTDGPNGLKQGGRASRTETTLLGVLLNQDDSAVAQIAGTDSPPDGQANSDVPDAEPGGFGSASASGTIPTWLEGGAISVEAIERNRKALSIELSYNFQDTPLTQVIQWLNETVGDTQFALNTDELEKQGVDPESLLNGSGTGSVREILRRLLTSLDLGFSVTESTIEIVSEYTAEVPSVRFHDLNQFSQVGRQIESLVDAIQKTIVPPQGWVDQGGESSIVTIGSVLVVRAPESTHHEIEKFLFNIFKMKAQLRNPGGMK